MNGLLGFLSLLTPYLSPLSRKATLSPLLNKKMYGMFQYYIVGLKLCLFRPFSRPQTFLRAKSGFHPRKPPLSSEETPGFIRAHLARIYKKSKSVKYNYYKPAHRPRNHAVTQSHFRFFIVAITYILIYKLYYIII